MASLGHVVVGMAAARAEGPSLQPRRDWLRAVARPTGRRQHDRAGDDALERLRYGWQPAGGAPCFSVHVQADRVVLAEEAAACAARGITRQSTRADVSATLGAPQFLCLAYSWSREPGGYFRARGVCFEHGVVADVVNGWSRDPQA